MLGIHSAGNDPGLEIVQRVWPGEDPFTTSRRMLLDATRDALGTDAQQFSFDPLPNSARCSASRCTPCPTRSTARKRSAPSTFSRRGTRRPTWRRSDERLAQAMSIRLTSTLTRAVLRKHGELWFNDEELRDLAQGLTAPTKDICTTTSIPGDFVRRPRCPAAAVGSCRDWTMRVMLFAKATEDSEQGRPADGRGVRVNPMISETQRYPERCCCLIHLRCAFRQWRDPHQNKKGSSYGEAKVTLDGFSGISQVWRKLDVLNIQQKATLNTDIINAFNEQHKNIISFVPIPVNPNGLPPDGLPTFPKTEATGKTMYSMRGKCWMEPLAFQEATANHLTIFLWVIERRRNHGELADFNAHRFAPMQKPMPTNG